MTYKGGHNGHSGHTKKTQFGYVAMAGLKRVNHCPIQVIFIKPYGVVLLID